MISIENTRFIFATNFAGDPRKDVRFGDNRRKCNIIIPDPQQAADMLAMGLNVRQTRPREDDDPETFQPEYFVQAVLSYSNRAGIPVKYPPRVYLVREKGEPQLLDEDSVDMLDDIRIKNVCVSLNPYEYDPVNHKQSLYIRTMYVEQDLDDDPFAARYRKDELPF